MIEVLNAGLQTTIQAGVREGHRHFGVPGSGPADLLSMSLANRLVGADATQPVFEMTLTGASFRFHSAMIVSVTGCVTEWCRSAHACLHSGISGR